MKHILTILLVLIGSIAMAQNPLFGSYIELDSGTTASRPSPAVNGMVRYNYNTDKFEGYQNGSWINFTDAGNTFGTVGQIPYTNAGGTDFDYSADLTFDGTDFNVGSLGLATISTVGVASFGNSVTIDNLIVQSDANFLSNYIWNSSNTDSFAVTSGASSAGRSGIIMYPISHASTPFDIEFTSDQTDVLRYDYSQNEWNFYDNDINDVEDIIHGSTSSMRVFAGTGSVTGIELYGDNHSNPALAGDIEITSDGIDVLEYSNSSNLWEMAGNLEGTSTTFSVGTGSPGGAGAYATFYRSGVDIYDFKIYSGLGIGGVNIFNYDYSIRRVNMNVDTLLINSLMNVNTDGVDVLSGGLLINDTEVITSSRTLTNIASGSGSFYETGTFTASFSDGSTTTTTGTWRYTRVGTLVTITGILVDINTTGLTAGSSAEITGIPASLFPAEINIGSVFMNQVTFTTSPLARLRSTGVIEIMENLSNAAAADLTVSDFVDDQADIRVTISYTLD